MIVLFYCQQCLVIPVTQVSEYRITECVRVNMTVPHGDKVLVCVPYSSTAVVAVCLTLGYVHTDEVFFLALRRLPHFKVSCL
ncbi:hypothetical protein D3C80_1773910 [compost metagenome]